LRFWASAIKLAARQCEWAEGVILGSGSVDERKYAGQKYVDAQKYEQLFRGLARNRELRQEAHAACLRQMSDHPQDTERSMCL
jgi:hypothetical protein